MRTQMFYPLRYDFRFMVEMKVEILDTTSHSNHNVAQ